MNGDTKLKLKGGLVGASCMLIIAFGGFAFGYGSLNTRVDGLTKKIACIEEVRERLVRVETIVERIDKKLGD